MTSRFRKQTTSLFVTIFIGLIVVSFLFTGRESFRGGANSLGQVNGHRITLKEFQNEYQRMTEFYTNMMGGKPLSTRQIEMMNIRQTAMNNLVQQKILFDQGLGLGLAPGPLEVGESIKSLPYFLTNETFDLAKYKAILRANGLTPSEFEDSQREAITVKKVHDLLSLFPFSSGALGAIEEFRNQKLKAHLVAIQKSAVPSLIPVSKAEVDAFLEEGVNDRRVRSLFDSRKDSLKSGDTEALYEDHRDDLARELIQRSKSTDEEEKILTRLKDEITTAFGRRGQGLVREIRRLEKRYGLSVAVDTEINRYDGPTGSVALGEEQVASLFQGEKRRVHTFEDGPRVVMVKLDGPFEGNTSEKNPPDMDGAFSNKFRQHIMASLREKATVKVDSRTIQ